MKIMINKTITFPNANSRETYFTLHNVKAAHKLALGADVKVGIIDWLFALDEHPDLYTGYADISGIPDQLQQSGHGYWMASTLREIAPKCEIFALNAIDYSNDANRITLLEKAVDWAIMNEIEILTYSHPAFSGSEKARIYAATERAANAGLISTFIHCDSPHNIWPYACYPYMPSANFERTPDVNILHYDYNVLMPDVFDRYCSRLEAVQPIQSGNDIPFFSFSSMSPVLAGFVALMKEHNRKLTADECRRILIETSYLITEAGQNWYDINPCQRVVDIGKAVAFL